MNERRGGITYIPDQESVLDSPFVSYYCSSNTEAPCLIIDVSGRPQSVINYLTEHLKKYPDHEATIKDCNLDNS
jgi:hypothetical protein